MYIHSNFKGKPTYTNSTARYHPIRIRQKLEAGEVEPLEQFATKENYDLHTEFVSMKLVPPPSIHPKSWINSEMRLKTPEVQN